MKKILILTMVTAFITINSFCNGLAFAEEATKAAASKVIDAQMTVDQAKANNAQGIVDTKNIVIGPNGPDFLPNVALIPNTATQKNIEIKYLEFGSTFKGFIEVSKIWEENNIKYSETYTLSKGTRSIQYIKKQSSTTSSSTMVIMENRMVNVGDDHYPVHVRLMQIHLQKALAYTIPVDLRKKIRLILDHVSSPPVYRPAQN